MIERIRYGGVNNPYNYSEFVCDTVVDLADLPTTVSVDKYKKFDTCSIGSKATVISDKTTYILNSNNQWIMLNDYKTYNECIGEMSSIRDEVRTLKEQIDDGVNPEVTQARVDANGTSYATLKERLDSTDENVEKIESVSTELKGDLVNTTHNIERLKVTYSDVATKGELKSRYWRFNGKEGEKFTFVNVSGQEKVLLYILYSDDTLYNAGELINGNKKEVTLEKDAKYVGYYPFYDGNVIIDIYGDVYEEIVGLVGNEANRADERIEEVKNLSMNIEGDYDFIDITEEIGFASKNGYYNNTNGLLSSDDSFKSSPLIDVEVGEVFLLDFGTLWNCVGLSIYDKYGNWLGSPLGTDFKNKGTFYQNYEYKIPEEVGKIGVSGTYGGTIREIRIQKKPFTAKECIQENKKDIDENRKDIDELKSYSNINTKYIRNNIFFNYSLGLEWYDGSDYSYDDFNEYTTVEQFYEKFNHLADDWYQMTKINLGKDASGQYDIYGYTIKPFDNALCSKSRPKIIITGAHHGFERGSSFAIYYLCKALREKQKHTLINELMYGFEWCLIPVVNPWGWDNYNHVLTDSETIGRNNSNNKDLARGYDDVENLEAEQIIVRDFILQHKDKAVLFIDYHNNGSTRYSAYAPATKNWLSLDSSVENYNDVLNIASYWANYFSIKATPTFFGGTQLGTSVDCRNGGGLPKWFADSLGIPSLTFEGTFKMKTTQSELETEEEYTPMTNKYNTVSIINFINVAMSYYAKKYINIIN